MEAKDITQPRPPSGYDHGPPWLFEGRAAHDSHLSSALYQLHLVKAEVARRSIPTEFKLVEAFGYTLGGLFLAHYDDSPAGAFDELVVLAGIVWNPPTSCAWAARVLVNSHEACKHGRKEIGLPSHFAEFSKTTKENLKPTRKKHLSVLNMIRHSSTFHNPEIQTEIQVIDDIDNAASTLCNIALPFGALESKQDNKWIGPMLKLSLPNFSGKTMDNPHLLKYSCHIKCRVRTMEAAKVSRPIYDKLDHMYDSEKLSEVNSTPAENGDRDLSISILFSKPILALEFSCLKMHVEAPIILSSHPRTMKS